MELVEPAWWKVVLLESPWPVVIVLVALAVILRLVAAMEELAEAAQLADASADSVLDRRVDPEAEILDADGNLVLRWPQVRGVLERNSGSEHELMAMQAGLVRGGAERGVTVLRVRSRLGDMGGQPVGSEWAVLWSPTGPDGAWRADEFRWLSVAGGPVSNVREVLP
jgi:hypothetical protein